MSTETDDRWRSTIYIKVVLHGRSFVATLDSREPLSRLKHIISTESGIALDQFETWLNGQLVTEKDTETVAAVVSRVTKGISVALVAFPVKLTELPASHTEMLQDALAKRSRAREATALATYALGQAQDAERRADHEYDELTAL